MNIGVKHSLCLISIESKMQPSESMPMKNSFDGLKSFRIWAGSIMFNRFNAETQRRYKKSFSASLSLCVSALKARFILHSVTPRRHFTTPARPIRVEEFAARFVETLVGVCAEIVALGLEKVGGKAFASVLIVERQRGA